MHRVRNRLSFRYLPALMLGWFYFFSGFPSFAQLNNRAFFTDREDSLSAGDLSFCLGHLNFLRNNEYFSPQADGYTLFGSQWLPTVRFQATNRVRLETGAYLRADYGGKGFQRILPILRMEYRSGKHLLRMGTLEGALAHGLIEPLYDFENLIQRRIENGFQWKVHTRRLQSDLWVDWQNMIYPLSPTQEEIWGGLHLKYHLLEKENFRLEAHLPFTAYHKGGQIDTVDQPLQTYFHAAPGLKASLKLGETGFFRELGLQTDAVFYRNQSVSLPEGTSRQSLSPYLNAWLGTSIGTFMVSYWQTTNFRNPRGGLLFPTDRSSLFHAGETTANRNILLVRYLKDWQIGPDIWITVRVEPVFDLKSKTVEFSHGLYFTYRGQIWKTRIPQ